MSTNNSSKKFSKYKLYISTNLHAQEPVNVGSWKFEEQVVDNRNVLVGFIEIEIGEYKDPMGNIESQVLDAIESPLTGLSFCLDGMFRVNPHKMEVSYSGDKRTQSVFYEDWRHVAFGRGFSVKDCIYVEKLTEAMQNDEFLAKLLNYYQLGLFLAYGFYYPVEAFLNFYKVIEMRSLEICSTYKSEFESNKKNELNEIASRIFNERRLDDSRHSAQIRINRIKNLIENYIKQKEITANDQVVFACEKLGLKTDIKIASRLIKIRNQGGIAHSSIGSSQWLQELRQCRDIARKFIVKYLISKGIIDNECYDEFMKVPSGIPVKAD